MKKSLLGLFALSVSFSSAAFAQGDFCQATPRLEQLSSQRCANFDSFSDSAAKTARNSCIAFYETVKQSAGAFCSLSRALDELEVQNRASPQQARVRSAAFMRQWHTQLVGGPRRNLEIALKKYQDSLKSLNEYGLSLLREEATSCGKPASAPAPAYLGLALSAGYDGAHTHQWLSDIFNGISQAMGPQGGLRQRLEASQAPHSQGTGSVSLARSGDSSHVFEPALKGLLTEALSQILRLHGLQSLGLDIAEKLLIAKKMDVLDLVVLASKAIVTLSGGASAGPTVGSSLGIALVLNGAIDYLESGIRGVAQSFENVAHARMEEVLRFYQCKIRREPGIRSDRLAFSYHHWRQDGICGAPCAQRGNFGMCRPSVLFHADRCQ
jgi:hypothetical protein